MLSLSILLGGCGAPRNKLKAGLENGKWLERYGTDTFKGRYKKGTQVGIWKSFEDGKLSKIERFRGNSSKVRLYHPNGKVKAIGHTKTHYSHNEIHWFYAGEWRYYDLLGKLIEIRTYQDGSLVRSVVVR